MAKKNSLTDTDTPHKGERGAVLTQKQYDLIVSFHKNGMVPSQIELEEAGIGDPHQSTYNKTGRFKSWARRMYLRLSDGALIHKITGKKILPQEKFESAILTAHRGSQAQGSACHTHHSTSATIGKMMKKYTFGKRSFGMNEDTVRDVVMSCTTGSCALKNKSQKKRSRKKLDTQHVSEKAKAKILELQNSLPVVRPRMIVPKESVQTPKTSTITKAVPLITASGSTLKPSYPMVYTNNIFNPCRPSVTATGIKQTTTAFIPHPGVPPNFIGVPQLLPGLTSKMYLVPHTPGTNFMSMLQATAPQTRQLNPGSNLPGHVVSTTTQPLKHLSHTSTFPSGQQGQHINIPDQVFGTNLTKNREPGKVSPSKTDSNGSRLLKSLANKSKTKFDTLKNTKTPELAKMLALPTLVKTSARNNNNESHTVNNSEPPLHGPLNLMKKVIENVESIVHDANTGSHETADKKTITICVFPFLTNSASCNISSVSSTSAEIPVTFQSSIGTDSVKTNTFGDVFKGQVSYSSRASVEPTQSITAPVISLETGLKADPVQVSPHNVLSESSANTKKKLKAKISAQRMLKGSKSPSIKDRLKVVSSNKSEPDDASLLLQDPDSQKSIKLDKPRLLHLLKKEKSSKVKALLLRTLRRLKKSKVNPMRSCLDMTNKEEVTPEEKFKCLLPESSSDQNVPVHANLLSELLPEDESSQQAEWNRKCMSVLGETISMYDPLLSSTFPHPCEEMEGCEKFPFPDSGPLPQPHIWHNYEDLHLYHRVEDLTVTNRRSCADDLCVNQSYGSLPDSESDKAHFYLSPFKRSILIGCSFSRYGNDKGHLHMTYWSVSDLQHEEVSSQRHCFRRLLPVFQDMKLDIMRSVMRDQSAAERLKKKIAYGESLVDQFREYLIGCEG